MSGKLTLFVCNIDDGGPRPMHANARSGRCVTAAMTSKR